MKSALILRLVVVMNLTLLSFGLSFALDKGGHIYQDELWNQNISFTDFVYVHGTLTITPGVIVDCNGESLTVRRNTGVGTGAVNNSVLINSDDSDTRVLFQEMDFIHIIGDEITRVDIGKTTFKTGSTNDALILDNVDAASVTRGTFENLGGDANNGYAIRISDGTGAEPADNKTISNCIIQARPFGIHVENGDAFGPRVVIADCQIAAHDNSSSRGIFLEELNMDDNRLAYDQYTVAVYDNKIVGTGTDPIGILVASNVVDQGSCLLANNVIRNCQWGILIEQNAELDVFNNAVYSSADNSVGYRTDGIANGNPVRFKNNIAWSCETGFQIVYGAGADFGDIEFVNNIIGYCTANGVEFEENPGNGVVKDNAFKGNPANHNTNFADAPLDVAGDDKCIIHGGSIYVTLVNEAPGVSYDFHIEMDNIDLGPDPDDLNNDLVNSGDNAGNTWKDPPTAYSYLRRVDGTVNRVVTEPDMGMFGGPFAIPPTADVPEEYDYIWVSDSDIRRIRPPVEFYKLANFGFNLTVGVGELFHVEPGTVIDVGTNNIVIDGAAEIDGNVDEEEIELIFDSGYSLSFTSNADASNNFLKYCTISGADYGIYLSGVTDSGSDRLLVENCTFTNCATGVYANNSRLHLKNTEITGSSGISGALDNGIYLTSCSSGKVIIEDCNIQDNGVGATSASAGIFLSSSDPEIIWTTVQDNSGGGIACTGSTPDLDTYDWLTLSDKPNTIQSNGGATQSGSDGAEIYLVSSSYPSVRWNNIVDYSSGPIGYMIYKDPSSNGSSLLALDNWWGASGTNLTTSFFYWGLGSAIDYSSEETGLLSNAEQYAIAMQHWSAGEFAECAEILEECVFDTGSVGINSVHYLSGCVGETPEDDRQGRLSYAGLRDYLQGVAGDHQDADVAKVASRFATDCLTQLGEYDDAMEEYDAVRENAECLSDSVMALLDWLAVYELANGNEVQSSGRSIQERMGKAFDALNRDDGHASGTEVPTEFVINAAYPNPFNSTTRIGFALPQTSELRVTVHDIAGREVAELLSGRVEAGWHQASWIAGDASAGVYIVKVVAGSKIATRKVLLVK